MSHALVWAFLACLMRILPLVTGGELGTLRELSREFELLLEQHELLLRDLKACKAETGWEQVTSQAQATPLPAPLPKVRIPLKIGFEPGIDHIGGPQRLYYAPKVVSEANRKHLARLFTFLDQDQVATSSDPVLRDTLRVLDMLAMAHPRRTLAPRTLNTSALPKGLHLGSSMKAGKRSTTLLVLEGSDNNGTGITFPRALLTESGLLKARILSLGGGPELASVTTTPSLPSLWEQLEMEEHSWYYGTMGEEPPHGFTGRDVITAVLEAADGLPVPPKKRAARMAIDSGLWCGERGVLTLRPKPGDAIVIFHHDAQLGLDGGAVHGYCPGVGTGKETKQPLVLVRQSLLYDPEEGNIFHRVLQSCS